MQSNKNRSVFFPVAMLLAFAGGCARPKIERERSVGRTCDDCELMVAGMPEALPWKAKLAADDEPGEPLMISGRIYKRDGKTPAPDVILYVYHADHTGLYTPGPEQVHARKHGHLHGWIKTDAQGRYEFRTIRPAAYPEGKDVQHIHAIIKVTGLSRNWIDDFLFDDDPLLTEQEKALQSKRGGSGIIKLTKIQQMFGLASAILFWV